MNNKEMINIDNLVKEFNLQVDLAVEANELVRGSKNVEISGVVEEVENLEHIKVNTITVTTAEAGQKLGKPPGTYITIQSPPLRINDPYVKDEIIASMGKNLTKILSPLIQPQDLVLLVGLGNWHAVADSLGPKFIEYSPITRHYHQHAPEALVEGMRSTCGIAPGVLGITGLETFEVIKGIVEKTQPAVVIAVDALAAQHVDRIGTSIQISDTGIQPGAGVGNARQSLNQASLGVPVIAIGCPTIVSAAVISNQAIRKFCLNSGAMYNEPQAIQAIKDTLAYFGGSLAVTPKEIDEIIENTARILAMGVATALFPNIEWEQLELYAV